MTVFSNTPSRRIAVDITGNLDTSPPRPRPYLLATTEESALALVAELQRVNDVADPNLLRVGLATTPSEPSGFMYWWTVATQFPLSSYHFTR